MRELCWLPLFLGLASCAPAPETTPDPEGPPRGESQAESAAAAGSTSGADPDLSDGPPQGDPGGEPSLQQGPDQSPSGADARRAASKSRPDTPPRHAVLIIIDTLRADAVDQALTPALDSLAAEGARAELAWASGTWTVPSVTSMLTGASVWEHGWNEPAGRMGKYPPLPALPRLPEVLEEAGFVTHGLYANPYLSEELGFDLGFNTWKHTSDRSVLKQFKKLVDQSWGDGERHFAYIHILGPHSPVDPSPAAQDRWDLDPTFLDQKGGIGIGHAKRNRREGIRDAYRKGYMGTVEDTDELVGSLLAALGAHRDQTLVILTSDHGELLGEHNIVGHGTWVWRELVEVPLFMDWPGGGETLPSALGIHAIPDLLTTALAVPYQWPQEAREGALLISQREGFLAWSSDGQIKLIASEEGVERFDLEAEPEELVPLPASPADLQILEDWKLAHPVLSYSQEASVSLPPETLEALQALGYTE